MSNKFVSFLEAVGRDFKKFLPLGEAAVEAFVPAISPLFNLVANQAITAEQNFAAIGQQTGSGSQKAAAVVAAIGNVVAQALTDAGKPALPENVTQFISAVVTILNSMPAASVAQVSAATPAVSAMPPSVTK